MKLLKDIPSFGAIDADSDDILLQVFEDHEAYQQVLALNRFVIIGRKGTGKTAIFKKILTLPKEDYITFGYTFADYPWNYHDAQKSEGMPEHEKYVHSWKYLILLTLSKIVLNYDMSLPFNDISLNSMAKIEQFVVDSYGTKDPDITQLFSPSRKLKLTPYFKITSPIIEAGISNDSTPITQLPRLFSEVNRNLTEHIFNCLNPNNFYFIAFDQLDLGFDPNSKDYQNRIIGLLLASREINALARSKSIKLLSTIFLRDDIYDGLHFEDKNKITQNFVSQIEWDTSRSRKTLKKLMERRFHTLLAETNVENITWEKVFDESQGMPGHQSKYQHIIDRTYLRPRDIINYTNEILKQHKIRIENQEIQQNIFINQDINLARPDYSNYFYQELDDEIHKHIPDYQQYFEIFRTIGLMQFNKKEYLEAFKKKIDLFPDITDPLSILKALFEFSVIGFYKVGGGYGGSEYTFKYIDRRAQFDSSADIFRIHLGLVDVLGLKRFSRVKDMN